MINQIIIRTALLLVLVSLFISVIHSQTNTVMGNDCVDILSSPTIPHTGNVKALIIYVKFPDDTYENDLTYDWPHVVNGHIDERPSWTENMLTKSLNQQDFEPSLTGFYRSMSFSNFQIYGDVYPQSDIYPKLYLTRFGYEHYRSPYANPPGTRDISTVVWEAITQLDNEIDFSQYDNDHDGYVDELIIWLRLGYIGITDGQSYNGIANLTGYWHNDFIDEFGDHLSEITTNDGIKIKYNSGLLADGP